MDLTVTYGVWEPATAVLNMVPDKELIRLGREDRVQVQVFYLDEYYSGAPQDKVAPDFRLLFDGEITGWQYKNTASGRFMSFMCKSHVAVFDQLYASFVHSFDTLVAAGGAPSSDTSSYIHNPLPFPASMLFTGLNASEKDTVIKRPYDFIENIFRALLSGDRYQYNSAVSRNFFTRWDCLTNFHNRWAPCPLYESEDLDENSRGIFPVLWAVQSDAAIKAILGRMGASGDSGSFWTHIQNLFTMLYYECTFNPTAPAVAYSLVKGKVLGEPAVGHPDIPTRIMSHVTKPPLPFTVPPLCNVMLPGIITNYGFSENYTEQPTRTYISAGTHVGTLTREELGSLHTAFPEEATRAYQAKQKNLAYEHQSFLVWPEEFFKGPVVQRKNTPPWFRYLQSAYVELGNKELQAQELPYLVSLYNTFEHYRARAATKNGAVEMTFNPYVVAGYPGVVLDREDTAVHIYAYVTSVTHTLSTSGMSTTASYSLAQTFEDFFESYVAMQKSIQAGQRYLAEQEQVDLLKELLDTLAVAKDAEGDKDKKAALEVQYKETKKVYDVFNTITAEDIIAAPLHPLISMRNRFQSQKGANEFYKQNLYRSAPVHERTVFSWKDSVGVLDRNNHNTVDPIAVDLAATPIKTNAVSTSAETPHFSLRGALKRIENDHDRIMKEIARPICTLEEYIDFHGERGLRRRPVKATHPQEGKGALYYQQILKFYPDDENTAPASEPPLLKYGHRNGLSNTDTRTDWVSRLKRYRHKAYNSLHPHRA